MRTPISNHVLKMPMKISAYLTAARNALLSVSRRIVNRCVPLMSLYPPEPGCSGLRSSIR